MIYDRFAIQAKWIGDNAMSTHTVNLDEAEGHLAELIELAQKGEEVVIAQKNKPAIKLVVCRRPGGKRVAGLHQGKVHLSNDFNDSLEDSFWTGEH